ncbi:chitin disaccharide deacetylase [uncultured Endozoicomonas sp.]|uniref:chitin disaccharide deacetylase n=1 Tax=uncultured Endozoicomonas sp. TaxID=432652 RepID=UPI002617AFAD|nr:chitin disaccharide deacetylase [uncultured Endozoicomonas sp.]
MKLIVNADDFGLTRGVNLGIIEAFQQGIVRSTTLMAGMPAELHAAELSRQNPELKVGIHLRLTTGQAMAEDVYSLIDSTGQLQNQTMFWENKTMSTQEIEKELRAQVEHFLKLGIELSHMDGHHHCHRHPLVAPVAQKLSDEYQVPLRPINELTQYKNKSLGFSDKFYGDNLTTESLLDIVKHYLGRVQVLELMTHPALVDEPLLKTSRYASARTRELAILTTPNLPQKLNNIGVTISDYSCLND